ncbi:MAG: hypothetical protein KGV59_00765 [Tenacibaculum sp.]|nr:hypothetical protein [Tenacibaculum sp.]
MNKWQDLKVYRNLPPKLVPLSFKLFAHYISEKLGDNFRLKESKTRKHFIYKSSELYEISIYFDNGSPYEKNQTSIKVSIFCRMKYKENGYFLSELYEMDNTFKMSYPLTKEFLLLADFLIDKIEKNIINFLDKILTPNDVIENREELKKYFPKEYHYKIGLRNLLFESAFLTRNKSVFSEICSEKIEEYKQQIIRHSKDEPFINFIKKLENLKNVFDNDNLYEKEMQRRKELAKNYKS